MAPAWIRTLIKSFCQQHSPKKAMSHSNSTNSAYSTNNNNAAQYLNDGEIGVTNSDQMFNALMEQYLSQGSSSTSHTPVPELSRDPRTGQTFQRGACPAGGPGQHHTRNSPSWGFSTPPQGYGSFSGPGQTALSTQGPNLASQPCFSDLMREMGHEHSRALYVTSLSPALVFSPGAGPCRRGLNEVRLTSFSLSLFLLDTRLHSGLPLNQCTLSYYFLECSGWIGSNQETFGLTSKTFSVIQDPELVYS